MDIAGHNLVSGQEGPRQGHLENPPGVDAGGSGREYQAAARNI